MKKTYRIKKNNEFQVVFKQGKSFANRQLVLYYKERNDQQHFRIGLSVSKKIGNAVVRNQIKRYLKQAFLELEDKILPHYDLVVIARQPTKNMGFFEMKSSLLHLLTKSKLISK